MMRQAMPGESTSSASDRGCRLAEPPAGQTQKPKLLERVRMVIRSRNLSPRTEEAYVEFPRYSGHFTSWEAGVHDARKAIELCLEAQGDKLEPLDFVGVQKVTVG